MRRWGVVISLVYVAIVLGLLVPAAVLLFGVDSAADFLKSVRDTYTEWVLWLPVVTLVGGQAALLFVSVDTSEKRLKPRGPVVRSAVIASMLLMILTVSAVSCIGVAIYVDHFFDKLPDGGLWIVGTLVGIWAAWGLVFYLYLRGKTEITTRVTSWLLRGSILELLIAVPSHVIVRRRHDCCAPVVTSFGITAGIAIMLLSFGPSVLLLYKKRMDTLRAGRERQPRVS
jgi:hypothetical protein